MCRDTQNVASVLEGQTLSGTEAKRTYVTRAYRGKMTTVGRHHFDRVQPLSRCNHRCVNETQFKVRVFPDQGLGSGNIFCLERFNHELAVGYRTHEGCFGPL